MEILTKLSPIFRLVLFLLTLPVFGLAQQFPVNNQKIVQGVGTTAQGISSYSSSPPTTAPTAATFRHVTSIHMDTVLQIQYIYKRPRWYPISVVRRATPPPATESSGSTTVDYTETIWQNTTDSTSYYYEEKQQCWQPVGTVVRDTTPVSLAATGTSAAVCYEYSLWYNSTNDSLYAYTAGDWLAIGSGGGGTAGAVDSIAVLQDSIIVGYSEGLEVTRDTIGYPVPDIGDIPGLADSLADAPSGSGTNQRIVVWTGTNSQGNSTLLQSAAGVTLDANLAYRITGGTTASRPTGAAGMMYWNTSNNWFDYHNGTSWFNPARSATTNGLFTAGSVLFAHSDGTVQQDAQKLFYNASNDWFGVGTNVPLGELHVEKNQPAVTGIRVVNTNASGIANMRAYAGAATFGFGVYGNTATAYGAISAADGYVYGNLGDLTIMAETGGVKFATGGTAERMRLTTSGRIGIGTTTPASLLDVEGGVSIGATYSGTTAAPSNGAIIEGSVGIGTNAPALKLDVRSTAASTTGVFSLANTTVTTPLKQFATNATPQSAIIGSPGDIAFSNAGFAYLKESGSATNTGWAKISTATDLGAHLPLTLTGATEVNTAGQNLYIRDAAGYPFMFMNANYFLAASGANNYIDVGSTASNVKVISDGLIELNSSVNTSLITTGRLLVDSDSIVIDATLPANTNATSVLVRDAVTKRLEEKAIGSVGTWLKPELEAGNDVVIASPGGNEVDISGIDFFYLNPDQGIELSAGTTILLQATNNVQALCDTFEVQGVVKITDITNGDATSIAGFNSGNVATTVTPGAGINLTSGEIRTTQSFFNSYDDEINLTSVTTTADTIRPASNTKSNDWSYGPTTYTHTYNGTASRYFSISVSAQVESPNCCTKAYIEVYKNGTVTSAKSQGYLTDATAAVTLHGQSIVLLSTGDTINAKFYGSEIGGEDYDILNYSLIVIQL